MTTRLSGTVERNTRVSLLPERVTSVNFKEMAPRGPNLSFKLRELIVFHAANGKSYKQISEIVNVTKSTVQNVVNRFNNEGRIDYENVKAGRPRLLSERDERCILRKIKVDPKVSAPKLTKELARERNVHVHPETVRRAIKRNGYNGRVARKKPFISEINRKKRLAFVQDHYLLAETWWNNVIFSDESKFNLFGSDGRVMVWRKKNEELKRSNLRPTVKHGGGSVMVWGCFSAAGVGNLVFIEGIMNKEGYLKILQDNLLQSAEKMGISKTFKFYQDNDPKHKSRLVQEWLLYRVPKCVGPPPQSPDLNPIENLWDMLENRIHETPITSIQMLKDRLQEEWLRLSPDYLRKLVSSMPRRLQHVLDQQGGPTKY